MQTGSGGIRWETESSSLFGRCPLRFTVLCAAVLPLILIGLSASATPSQTQEPALVSGVPVPAGAVAVINDQTIPIPRFVDAVHRRYASHTTGVETLNALLQERIIRHNMKERGLSISDDDVAKRYDALDRRIREATQGKKTIDTVLEEQGLSKDEFLAKLRMETALHRMTAKDFGREDVLPADEVQWLRSKTLQAKVERDASKLPKDAAARVYGEFITKTDFVKTLLAHLPKKEVLQIVQSMMQEELAQQMLESQGGHLEPSDIDRVYDTMKTRFESDPRFQGLSFPDFIREREGMGPETHKASAGFRREACLNLLAPKLVPDKTAATVYEREKEYYGPVYELAHILIRGSDRAKDRRLLRSMADAKKEADKIMKRLRKGESFKDAVKLYSEDSRTKFKGGVIGSYTPKTAREAGFGDEVSKAEVGAVFGPIRDGLGYHIYKLVSKKPAPPLDEKIVADLRLRAAHRAFAEAWRDAKKGIDLHSFLGTESSK